MNNKIFFLVERPAIGGRVRQLPMCVNIMGRDDVPGESRPGPVLFAYSKSYVDADGLKAGLSSHGPPGGQAEVTFRKSLFTGFSR